MGRIVETLTHSIAIQILDQNVIMRSNGNELHIYKATSLLENNLICEVLDIKLTHNVHGIELQKSSGKLILVYGEKEFLLIEIESNYHFREVYRSHLTDWIIATSFLQNANQFVLLTAHSVIFHFEYHKINYVCQLKERVSCHDKSTLYCAQFFGSNWEDIVIFSGNAFGELLIWKPFDNSIEKIINGYVKKSPLLHRISAHNGVIFSVDYDESYQILLTTSDDRSVKWWDVIFCMDNKNKWEYTTFRPRASSYGHLARVFKGRNIRNDCNLFALSVGEDSNFCLWKSNGELILKHRQEYGTTLWNFAYNNDKKTIYTVGSTGNLIAYDLSEIFGITTNKKNCIISPTVLSPSNEYVTKIKFLNTKELIAITNCNHIVLLQVINKSENDKGKFEEVKWIFSGKKLDFKCSVLAVYKCYIALCGYKRLLVLKYKTECQKLDTIFDGPVLNGLIRTFIFFGIDKYLISDNCGHSLVFFKSCTIIRQISSQTTNTSCNSKHTNFNTWHTSGLLLNNDEHLLLSNRQGNLLLYANEYGQYQLKQIVKRVHGNLGSTCLYVKQLTERNALIGSAGHSNTIIIFSINFETSSLIRCFSKRMPVLWIEDIVHLLNCPQFIIGFNDNHFVVWSRTYDFMVELECGGGHRSWHYIIADSQMFLVFLKNKQVCLHQVSLFNGALITLPPNRRWHTAACNSIEIIKNNSNVAISGGDDNLIKIHNISLQGLKWQTELHSHISNVKALKVLTMNNSECLLFSGGGRSQLCITFINTDTFHKVELLNYTLKNIHKQKFCNKSDNIDYNYNPEIRIMALDVLSLNNNHYNIYLGCADGTIRLLSFILDKRTIEEQIHYSYGKCILQIRLIESVNLLVMASTDGKLNFYDHSMSKYINELAHHQSGVNSLSILFKCHTKLLQILTGGDDQAVCYTEIYVQLPFLFNVRTHFHKEHLHSSQVSAVSIHENGLYGFSTGIDQMLYKIRLHNADILAKFYTCIPDIKGIRLWPYMDKTYILIYGDGVQIYTFDD